MPTNTLLENTIDLCIQSGLNSLKRAKFAWWPTEGQSDFSEDNLWFHVGWALQNAGFHVYPKAQVAGSVKQHVDAVAIHREYRCALVIEAKRLYSSEKFKSLGNDWLRLQQFKLPCQWLSLPRPLACYALLCGSCWNAEHVQWWIDPSRCCKSDSWLHMQSALESATRIGAVDVQRPDWQPHWICYSLSKLPDDQWCGITDSSPAHVVTGE